MICPACEMLGLKSQPQCLPWRRSNIATEPECPLAEAVSYTQPDWSIEGRPTNDRSRIKRRFIPETFSMINPKKMKIKINRETDRQTNRTNHTSVDRLSGEFQPINTNDLPIETNGSTDRHTTNRASIDFSSGDSKSIPNDPQIKSTDRSTYRPIY